MIGFIKKSSQKSGLPRTNNFDPSYGMNHTRHGPRFKIHFSDRLESLVDTSILTFVNKYKTRYKFLT